MSNQGEQNNSIAYEVRQQVRTVREAWLVPVYKSSNGRLAKISFDDLKRDSPDEYFEFIKVTHSEECLGFSDNKDQ